MKTRKSHNCILTLMLALFCASAPCVLMAQPTNSAIPAWLTQPLALSDAVNLSLKQNAAILKSQQDVEAAHGIVVQIRAVAIPKLQATGGYNYTDALDIGLGGLQFQQEQSWNSGLRLVQSVYEGGRIRSSLRSAKFTREQSIAQHQAVIADTLLEVRRAYYDTLLAEQQIKVRTASVDLLQRELQDTTRRYEAGTVPRFDVLRAEVELANAKPRLSRARNAWRISKNNLANLLGYNLPTGLWEDIPLQLTDRLEAVPYTIELPAAVAQALERRPELVALRASEGLAKESVTTAKSGYKPSIQVFGGYGWRSSAFQSDLTFTVEGWNAGAELNWQVFDGGSAIGRVTEARANERKAAVELDDAGRRIELEVRTAYSTFIEAKEVLDSTEKVVEQAEEALRLAKTRYDAGSGTQLDVLDAETSLTEARTIKNEALHSYMTAQASLARAIGQDVVEEKKK
jgi:outer membrane protein